MLKFVFDPLSPLPSPPCFFAGVSQVKILPTVICFNDGVAVHNIIGFEGLTAGLPDDKLDEWPLSNLARELALAKVRPSPRVRLVMWCGVV